MLEPNECFLITMPHELFLVVMKNCDSVTKEQEMIHLNQNVLYQVRWMWLSLIAIFCLYILQG